MAKENQTITDRLYDFFSSIKLSIFVLVSLAATSIIGTVVEQGESAPHYLDHYGSTWGKVINLFNFGDMYHSWWFMLLLALLLINITFCSIKRLPNAIRQMNDKDPLFDKRSLAVHEKTQFTASMSQEDAAKKAEELLGKKLAPVIRAESDGATYLMSTKGGWCRMGVYVTHFSLFLFAVGAIVGILWGFKGFVGIVEGTSSDTVRMRGMPPVAVTAPSSASSRDALLGEAGNLASQLAAACAAKGLQAGNLVLDVTDSSGVRHTRAANFNEPASTAESISTKIPFLVNNLDWDGSTALKSVSLSASDLFKKLDFTISCDSFQLDLYPNGRPKDYVSNLSVLKNGSPLYSQRIEVNSPLIHDGIYFYQSSYGKVGIKSATVTLVDRNGRPVVNAAKIAFGKGIRVADGGEIYLRDYEQDNEDTGEPAAAVFYVNSGGQQSGGKVYEASAFGGGNPFMPLGPYFIRMDKADWAHYTGLQVAKDPGVPIVWAGCILITIGLVTSFFVSHRRVFAKVWKEDGKVNVLFAGNASRNRVSFEKWFEDFKEEASDTFKKS